MRDLVLATTHGAKRVPLCALDYNPLRETLECVRETSLEVKLSVLNKAV